MCALYVLCVFVFGVWYLSFSDECGMDFGDRLEAYYFSLETMATIGYGTQDYFFGHCWEPLAIINLQVVLGLVIESLRGRGAENGVAAPPRRGRTAAPPPRRRRVGLGRGESAEPRRRRGLGRSAETGRGAAAT